MKVTFENVVKKYGDFTAVKDLSIEIKNGSLHFLLGPSGCGKTTTLRMLAGLEKVTSGRILFDGKDVTDLPSAERGIGMVFQNYALWPHMTVLKNIEYGLKLRKLSSEDMKARLDNVLDYTKLTQFVDRLPGQLSGGQQQRVALARALAIRPNVLLLDEPLSNLDAKLRLEMRDNITRIHRETGITTVYVTHDQKEALSMGTDISVMRAGLMIQTNSPRELYRRPKTPFIAGFIGETNFIRGTYKGSEQVETAYGTMNAGVIDEKIKEGDACVLSFRPEALQLPFNTLKSNDTTNKLSLKLDHMTYLGESEHFHFKTNDGVEVKSCIFNAPDHDFKEDQTLECHVEKHEMTVLAPESDMSSGT